jgi:hypothetical protein
MDIHYPIITTNIGNGAPVTLPNMNDLHKLSSMNLESPTLLKYGSLQEIAAT